MITSERVISYIDGYNLYYGLREAFDRRYLWLDLEQLSKSMLKPNQQLTITKYFTAMVSEPPAIVKRQTTYIDALKTLNNFEIYYGYFQKNTKTCERCGYKTSVSIEKMTDVNIAVELMKDAFLNRFDKALLISADSDLVPVIDSIKALFPNKKIIIAFPPKRSSKHLRKCASGVIHVSRSIIEKSMLPNTITIDNGYILERPAFWY